jgi:PAS domain S-box-containing protein
MITVLYVDDEPDLLSLSKMFLERTGDFSVTTVESAIDALELLDTKSFDAIISDYQMPEKNGIGFLADLRKKFPDVPFILFTGRGREEVAIQAFELGADFYLQKGGEPKAQFAELSHKIRQAIRRRKAEEELKKREQQLNEMAANIPGVVYRFYANPDGTTGFDYISEHSREILGLENDPATFFDRVARGIVPEYREQFVKSIEQAIREKKRWEFECQYVKPSGKTIWLSAVSSPVIEKDRLTFDGVIFDNTGRKNAEEALQQSEKRLKRAEEIAGIGHWEIHRGTGSVIASAGARNIYGLQEGPVSVREIKKIPLPGFRPLLDNLMEDLVAGRKTYDVEFKIRWPADGTVLDIHSVAEYDPVKNAVFGVIHDITGQKRAQKAILESGEYYRAVFKYTEAATMVIEEDTTISLANDAFAALYGRPREEIEGKIKFPDIGIPEEMAVMKEYHRRRRIDPGDAPGVYEFRFLTFDKRIRDVLIHVGMIPGTRQSVASLLDITERKQAQEALRLDEQRLEAMVRLNEMGEATTDELATFAMDEAIRLTGSTIGYISFYDEDCRTLTMHAWSKSAMEECGIATKPLCYPIDSTGLWGEAVRQRHPIITNDYPADNPLKKGVPQGHVHLTRHMNVPVLDGNRIVIVAGVGNKPSDYDESDIRQLTLLMSGMWRIIQRRNAELALRQKNDELQASFQQIAAQEEELRGQVTLLAKNERMIRESEGRFRAILDNIQDVFYQADPEGVLTTISPSGAVLFGYESPDDLIGKKIADTFYANPADRETILARLKSSGKVTDYEVDLRRSDGSAVKVSTSSHYFFEPDKTTPAGIEGIFRDITDRKKAELALLESEVKYRTIFETTGTASVIIEPDKTLSLVNRGFEELSGYRREEIEGKMSWIRFVDTGDRERMKIQHDNRRLHPSEIPGSYTFRFIDRQGTVHNIYLTIAMIPGTGKSIASLLDITSIKEAEERFRSVFDTSPLGMVLVDKYFRFTLVNPSFASMMGYEAPELAGKRFTDITHEEDRVADIENANKLGRGEIPYYNTIKRYIRKNGDCIWGSVTVSPMPSEQGNPVSFLAVIENITEKREMEENLRENETKFHEIFDNISDSVQINEINENGVPGKFIELNSVACRMLGYSREELLSRNPLDFATGYHSRPLDQIFEDMKTTGHARFETEHIRKDGTIFPVEVNIRVVVIKKKRVALAVIRDISDRKRDELALREIHKKLTLLSGITRHDINNQVSVLRAFLTLLEENPHDPSRADYFRKVAAAADNISRMIRFAKEYEQIGIRSPAWQDCNSLFLTAMKYGWSGRLKLVNDIPPGSEVFADPLIARAFYNLMDNAEKYGGKITGIRFSLEDRNGAHVIVYEDDGVGIPAGEKEKIFEKNFGKNTGLGLFLSREILSITGITIHEAGEPGRGARFEIRVPEKMFRRTSP